MDKLVSELTKVTFTDEQIAKGEAILFRCNCPIEHKLEVRRIKGRRYKDQDDSYLSDEVWGLDKWVKQFNERHIETGYERDWRPTPEAAVAYCLERDTRIAQHNLKVAGQVLARLKEAPQYVPPLMDVYRTSEVFDNRSEVHALIFGGKGL